MKALAHAVKQFGQVQSGPTAMVESVEPEPSEVIEQRVEQQASGRWSDGQMRLSANLNFLTEAPSPAKPNLIQCVLQ